MSVPRPQAIVKVLLGIFAGLLGFAFLAFAGWMLIQDSHGMNKGSGLWIFAAVPGAALSIGGIGTIVSQIRERGTKATDGFIGVLITGCIVILSAAFLGTGGHPIRLFPFGLFYWVLAIALLGIALVGLSPFRRP